MAPIFRIRRFGFGDPIPRGDDLLDKARTMAFSVFVLLQLWNVFNCRSETRSVFTMGYSTNKYLFAAVALTFLVLTSVLFITPFQVIFRTVDISVGEYLYLIVFSSLTLWVEEGRKWWNRRSIVD